MWSRLWFTPVPDEVELSPRAREELERQEEEEEAAKSPKEQR
jgi:hypothetical protein